MEREKLLQPAATIAAALIQAHPTAGKKAHTPEEAAQLLVEVLTALQAALPPAPAGVFR